ncbi:hypothetical protein PR048_032067 [Dryococelus australis]|uniref:Uncharacterized protein n=1 Tax=Dryococelus australis TaxID=614101 RepID=A0ABQ9G175_9NEOP|nr:hypothetical protein PR048_032067 [Dryococelus australis]
MYYSPHGSKGANDAAPQRHVRPQYRLRRGRGGVVDRLLASHPSEPAGSLPDHRMWESCRTMPLVGGFSPGSPVSPALAFHTRLASPSLALKTSLEVLRADEGEYGAAPELKCGENGRSLRIRDVWHDSNMRKSGVASRTPDPWPTNRLRHGRSASRLMSTEFSGPPVESVASSHRRWNRTVDFHIGESQAAGSVLEQDLCEAFVGVEGGSSPGSAFQISTSYTMVTPSSNCCSYPRQGEGGRRCSWKRVDGGILINIARTSVQPFPSRVAGGGAATRQIVSKERRQNARAGRREIPEKTRRPAASSETSPTCKNLGATPPGIKPCSLRWEASSLTTTTPRPH